MHINNFTVTYYAPEGSLESTLKRIECCGDEVAPGVRIAKELRSISDERDVTITHPLEIKYHYGRYKEEISVVVGNVYNKSRNIQLDSFISSGMKRAFGYMEGAHLSHPSWIDSDGTAVESQRVFVSM